MKTIQCPIKLAAKATPDRMALALDKKSISYTELDSEIDNAVSYLRGKGIGKGDIVAVLDNNSISYAIMFFASFRLGSILMPLNTRLTKDDWKNQLNDAGCEYLLCGKKFTDIKPIPDIEIMPINEIAAGGRASSTDTESTEYDLKRDALIIFSSGTSGDSRGIVLTWENIYYSALGAQSSLGCHRDDNWLAVLPFFHVGGISLLFRSALVGSGVRIFEKFDPDAIINIAMEKQGHYLSVVPTMLRELIKIDNAGVLRDMKAIIVGGAAFDESIRNEVISRKLPVLTTYGMTETSSMVTLLPMKGTPEKLKTAGKVLPYREVMIADEDGKMAPAGHQGKIHVRGEVLFSRYINQSAPSTNSDGWFATGDIGRLDSDGFLTVSGRSDSIIISGGENIDLDQIELSLNTIEGITGAVVLARIDEKWGQRPVAFVQLSNPELTEPGIIQLLKSKLAPMMIPDRVIILDKIPLTGIGKYDRQALKIQFQELLDGGE